MANTSAAKKYMRVSARKRERNDAWREKLRSLRVTFRRAVEKKDTETIRKTAHEIQSVADRMGRRNIIHPNTASRLKARVAAKLRSE